MAPDMRDQLKRWSRPGTTRSATKPIDVMVMMIFWLCSPSAKGPPRILRSSNAGSRLMSQSDTTTDAAK